MKRKVLLVDDDPDTQITLRDILESDGYDVSIASTGDQALGMVDGYHPDIILLDIMMPGTDGIEVARRFSHRGDSRDIPIVVITALHEFRTGSGIDEIEGIRLFIYKPCRPRTLLEGIEDVLRYQH